MTKKKLAKIVIASLLAILVLVYASLAIANSRNLAQARAMLAEMDARGEATNYDAYLTPEVPDDENAAKALEETFPLITMDNNFYKELEVAVNLLFDGDADAMEESSKKLKEWRIQNKELLDSVDVAMARKFSKFYKNNTDPQALVFTSLLTTRRLSDLLRYDAYLSISDGDEKGLVKRIDQITKISESLASVPMLVSFLFAGKCMDRSLSVINKAALEMELSDTCVNNLTDILNRFDYNKDCRRALLIERSTGVYAFEKEHKDHAYLDWLNSEYMYHKYTPDFIFRQFFGADYLLYLDIINDEITAQSLPFYESRVIDTNANKATWDICKTAYMTNVILPSLLNICRNQAKFNSKKRMLLLQLALLKHSPLEKPSIEEIRTVVANKDLLIDPFTGEDLKLTVREGKTYLYCLGSNMKDDKGLCWSSDLGDDSDVSKDADDIAFCISKVNSKKLKSAENSEIEESLQETEPE